MPRKLTNANQFANKPPTAKEIKAADRMAGKVSKRLQKMFNAKDITIAGLVGATPLSAKVQGDAVGKTEPNEVLTK